MKKAIILIGIFIICTGVSYATDVKIKTVPTIIAESAANTQTSVAPTPATSNSLPPLPQEVNYSASVSGTAIDKIRAKVNSYLQGGAIPIVEERPTDLKLEKKYEKVRLSKDDPGTLIALNVAGGVFEGAIIGTGCGLLGYADFRNRDIAPLLNGAFIGLGAGVIGSTVLSLVELNVDKYYFSSDYGIDILGGCVIGSMLGTCGGVISYIKTKAGENILEGVGYGASIGTALGFVAAIVEMVIPSQYRGAEIRENHALHLEFTPDATLLTYSIKY